MLFLLANRTQQIPKGSGKIKLFVRTISRNHLEKSKVSDRSISTITTGRPYVLLLVILVSFIIISVFDRTCLVTFVFITICRNSLVLDYCYMPA